jgi:hypothetical protein
MKKYHPANIKGTLSFPSFSSIDLLVDIHLELIEEPVFLRILETDFL